MFGTIRLAALVLACGALLMLDAAGGQSRPRSERSFAADMLKRARAEMPDAELTPDPADPLSVTVRKRGEEDSTVNFHRIFDYCRAAAAADCKAVRDDYIDKLRLLTEAPPLTVEALRLIVRDRDYVESVRSFEKDKPMLIAEPIGDDLFAVLAADAAETVMVVPPHKLAELGLTHSQAWQRALKQTRAVLPALPKGASLKEAGVFYQDHPYYSSLLIDLAAWRPIAAAAGPDLFVTVVAENLVLVGTMPGGSGLEKFKQVVRDDCASQPRCISPNVYRFRGGRWVIAP